MSSAIDVCEGCRRLRKRCDKDNCVLHPCLESLWPSSRQSQGNATVFLAKYFGRKRFFKLLEAVNSQQRAALFESLLQEACGRTVNPLGGATGLLRADRWAECQTAVTTVLNGEPLQPVPDAPSTPTVRNSSASAYAPPLMVPVRAAGPSAALREMRTKARRAGQSKCLHANDALVAVPAASPVASPVASLRQNGGLVEAPPASPGASVCQNGGLVEAPPASPSPGASVCQNGGMVEAPAASPGASVCQNGYMVEATASSINQTGDPVEASESSKNENDMKVEESAVPS